MTPLLVVLGVLAPMLALALVAMGLVLHRTGRRIRTLEQEARHDPLTGLPNRRGLKAHWDSMKGSRALLLIDLVGFKAVNDSHGHVVGDTLLKQVSARLMATVPPPGILARWGGDEFVAVVPLHQLEGQKRRIVEARTAGYDLSPAGGPEDVRVGARFGASLGEPELGLAIRQAARDLLNQKAAESGNDRQ